MSKLQQQLREKEKEVCGLSIAISVSPRGANCHEMNCNAAGWSKGRGNSVAKAHQGG